ncbi:hypothetical protein DFH06DRAFT_1127986 [Mycena polygramma]|nr:hypothetical protein DFH06DRAFT_1127986 [Mycena polygramma]
MSRIQSVLLDAVGSTLDITKMPRGVAVVRQWSAQPEIAEGQQHITSNHCGHLNLPPPLDLPSRNGANSRLNLPTSTLRAYVADIRSEILRYRRDVAVLEAKERELESQLALVIYPVLTLPTEIISLIFVHCLPDHGRVRPSPRKPPLLLAQICSLWRGIALSTGLLWASVDIHFESPISLTIRSEHSQLAPGLLSLIPSFGHQIQRLELRLSPEDYERLRGLCAEFPSLRDLALWGYQFPIPDDHPVTIFGRAPLLHRMRILSDVHSAASFGAYAFLTTLELTTTSIPIVLELLVKYPRLLHFKAVLWDPFHGALPHVPPLAVGLQSLVLAGGHPDEPIPPLLDFLMLPYLRRLDLRPHPEFEMVQALLERSRCALDHLGLWIRSEDQATGGLEHILQTLSALSLLDLHAGPHIDAVLHTLSRLRDPVVAMHVLVPKLKCLTLTTWNGDFDYELLLRLLRLRRDSSSRPVALKSFHLQLSSDLHLADIVRSTFEELMSHGRISWLVRPTVVGPLIASILVRPFAAALSHRANVL